MTKDKRKQDKKKIAPGKVPLFIFNRKECRSFRLLQICFFFEWLDMQERKRSDTATKSLPRKDGIEATKGIKFSEPNPLTLLPCLSFVLPKNKPGDFKGKTFYFLKIGVSSRWCKMHPPFVPTFPGRCSMKSGCGLCTEEGCCEQHQSWHTLTYLSAVVGPP